MNETNKMIQHAVDADKSNPGRLYDHPSAPTYWPAAYFVRKLLMVRVGADGIPEVVTA